MKYSKQRELILQTLRMHPTHPTAEDLYWGTKKTMPNISLGTVYRNLNLLVEAKTISRVEGAGTIKIRYDGRNDEHCHLVCTQCGRIQDIGLEFFFPIDDLVQDKLGFCVSEHGIVLKGICNTCQRSASKSPLG